MAKLRVVDGPLSGTEYKLAQPHVLAGRHSACTVSIPDPKVSRNHAEFIRDNAGCFSILDIGSSNGTLVNGIFLQPNIPRPLSAGDEIRMGQNTFRFFQNDARLPAVDIPGYVLEDILAEGGMGSIIQARTRDTDQPAAIKLLHTDYAQNREAVDRFIQEARAAGRLSHPNIIRVYNVGKTSNGRYYFTMELVRGTTLTQRISLLSLRDATRIFLEIADALAYAHKRGIIHRDIKPDNILISLDGTPKLTDLGIAVLDQEEFTQKGRRVLGTPHYMSPEQASGRKITPATDIYSLGATFFHVYSGQPLFDAATPEEIMVRHVRERPRSILGLVPDMPGDLAAIIDRTLHKDPESRFADAAELRDALADMVRHHWPDSMPRGIETRQKATRKNKKLLWAAAGAAAVILALLLFF